MMNGYLRETCIIKKIISNRTPDTQLQKLEIQGEKM